MKGMDKGGAICFGFSSISTHCETESVYSVPYNATIHELSELFNQLCNFFMCFLLAQLNPQLLENQSYAVAVDLCEL